MYNSQDIALRIKSIAKKKGVSIMKLQEDCGLGKNAINQLANSQDGMKSKSLNSIANYLDISIDYLLGRVNNPTNIVEVVQGYSTHSNRKILEEQNINLDEMSKELLQRFQKLSFDDKLKVFNYIKDKENRYT